MNEGVVVAAVVAVVIAIVLALFSMTNIDAPIKESESGVSYKVFYLEGMPCVYVTEGVGNGKTGGPSCDWSKWRHGK